MRTGYGAHKLTDTDTASRVKGRLSVSSVQPLNGLHTSTPGGGAMKQNHVSEVERASLHLQTNRLQWQNQAEGLIGCPPTS